MNNLLTLCAISPPFIKEAIMHSRPLLVTSLCCLLGFLGWGCSSQADPNKSAIESKLKGALKLKEIHLTETEKGKFEGTGTSENGTTHKIKATQTQSKTSGVSRNELRWEAEGSNGTKSSGGEGTEGNQ